MNIHAISNYLQRFDAPPATAPEPAETLSLLEGLFDAPLRAHDEEPIHAPPPPPESFDIDALRRDFDAHLAAALEAQQAAHDENLRAARAQWIDEQGAVLARRLSESLDAALEALRSDVARVLAPFVAEEIQAIALGELTESIRRAIAGEDAPAIRIDGPADIIGKLADSLAGERAAVTLSETETIDVTVDLGLTKIDTRLEAWMRRLTDSRSQVS